MRILSLVAVMVALLVVALLSKRQLAAVQAPEPAGAVGGTSAVQTPAKARQMRQQVQDDINRISQERGKQLEQSLERSEP